MTRTLASNITYQPLGDIISMMYGNGIVTTKIYNNRYQLNNLSIGTLKQLSYSRDNIGNITGIADNLNPNNTKSYSYDNLYRLTLSTGSWGAITYAYDFVGNRTYETTDAGNTTYTYTTNTNKLASTSGEKVFNFNFDNNGNTTAENTRQYIYNQNQRLIKVMDGSNVLGEYLYNGNGQRADKLIPSQNKCTVFHYDQNGLLITESTRTGNIKAEYVYLNGQPLAKIENNNIYYYHNDHLGTPIMMTDNSGSVVWQREFLPFGESLSVTGSITNNLRFPGQYYDSETGLHQNGFRDYKTEIGRYPQADPIGLLGGVNLFTYVGNNPVNFVDPLGLADAPLIYGTPGYPANPNAPNLGKLLEIVNSFARFKISVREMNKADKEILKAQCEIIYGQTKTVYLLIGKIPPRFVGLSHTHNVLVDKKDVEILPRVIEGLKGGPSVPGFGNICDEIKRCK